MVILNKAVSNSGLDEWGDKAWNNSAWAGPSRKSSHDKIGQVMASCMSWAGFPTYAHEKKVPLLPVPQGDEPTRKRGDLCTSTGGLVGRNGQLGFDNQTRMVGDIKLVHVYASQGHAYKPDNIRTAYKVKHANIWNHDSIDFHVMSM